MSRPTEDQPGMTVRTRFAPSPTGRLHAGNARVAVFNWAFARHHRGTFILRVEDTDVERNVENSLETILEDLRWLGTLWDEGPEVGGGFGPYRQSERKRGYAEAARRLVEAGLAYPCYCGVEGAGEAGFRYPGTCRTLTRDERVRREREGTRPVTRFHVPDGEIVVRDEVYGTVSFPPAEFGDFVIVRADGRPTYNFAVVVDDIAMRITHVIRGVGHLSNTPRQAVLFDALDAPRPVFAHLPMVLGADRRKLSKREGASSLALLREAGYPASAVMNYLSLLGWSAPDGEEILTPVGLVREVGLERIGASNTVYDPAKLRWVSGRHIAGMPLTELARAVAPFVDPARVSVDRYELTRAVDVIRGRMTTFAEINDHLSLFLVARGPELDRLQAALRNDAGAGAVLRAVAGGLAALPEWEARAIGRAIRAAGKKAGARGPALFHPVRKAVTGRESGPDLGQVLAVYGRDETLERISAALPDGLAQD
ncbi:MAG: glutamate--tRNA ligase [Gammaproteobacteria bacterium]|nr:glutamate--tRNA ligase [Gammaproteobacteria bacterium]